MLDDDTITNWFKKLTKKKKNAVIIPSKGRYQWSVPDPHQRAMDFLNSAEGQRMANEFLSGRKKRGTLPKGF